MYFLQAYFLFSLIRQDSLLRSIFMVVPDTMIGNLQILPVSHPAESLLYDFTALCCVQLHPFIVNPARSIIAPIFPGIYSSFPLLLTYTTGTANADSYLLQKESLYFRSSFGFPGLAGQPCGNKIMDNSAASTF